MGAAAGQGISGIGVFPDRRICQISSCRSPQTTSGSRPLRVWEGTPLTVPSPDAHGPIGIVSLATTCRTMFGIKALAEQLVWQC